MLGRTLFDHGELLLARAHLEQGLALYDSRQHRSHAFSYGYDPGVAGLSCIALVLWHLGYMDQALEKGRDAVILAQELSHPYSLAFAFGIVAEFHQFRREVQVVQARAKAAITLSDEQGFPVFSALGTILQGWALTEQSQEEEGIAQMRQGLTTWRATGAEMWQSHFLALLAEVYGKMRRVEEGLVVLAEAMDFVQTTGERYYEAELYRLKGELTLQLETRGWRLETSPPSSQASSLKSQAPSGAEQEAEGYFLKAIEIAQKQQAKSLELRATTSLARLWQQQGKTVEAHKMLEEIYSWFTEGFDTVDLKEAQALLSQLADDPARFSS
jgi:predicted ATPase